MGPAKKPVSAVSDLYTAILALATGVVLATAIFVTVKCHIDYGTIFKIVQSTR
ncbi:MAG TPA: hypothetical protein P5279_14820 [Anaerohalosphaeraceae bacterium]|jgi:hypothetical protein|nr:hypothetical protein [Anaerohalosphaeraceae bacterium]HRT51759.1 hypothetical protein [Anaerohalosphaeraceae bacterium]HRT87734.1 hypothetical protein [Anaerohalosphaeraceae bacterium]